MGLLDEARKAARIGKKFAKDYKKKQARAANANRDVLDQVKKLGELRDSGVITEDEFQEKKRKLLDKVD